MSTPRTALEQMTIDTNERLAFFKRKITEDLDTQPQCDLFDGYLKDTGEDRQQYKGSFGYDECEWEAFQAGWNAAKHHFGVV